jgi:sulfatase maturation enzyme AslB (radical SAM superfamily)
MIKPDLEGVKGTLEEYPFPVDIIVEVTGHCNLRCIMCPYPNLTRPKGNMAFSTFTRIVDETARENPRARIWLAIMGEPLILGEKISSFIRYAKEHGIREVCLNTNATLLTQEVSRGLLQSGLDKILVSIDAHSAPVYDAIRVGGDYSLVCRNVENFIRLRGDRSGPEVIAQFIVMEENESEVESFKRHWLERGATVKIRPKLGWGNAVRSSILDQAAQGLQRFPCAWLTRTVSIHWDGTFSQCDADHEGLYSPGHIHRQSIKQVWDGPLAERRSRHWRGDYDFQPCDNCKDWLAGRSYFFHPEGSGR